MKSVACNLFAISHNREMGNSSYSSVRRADLASLYQAKPPLNKILADQNPSSDPRSTDRTPGLTDR
jgi:hypothetical protein